MNNMRERGPHVEGPADGENTKILHHLAPHKKKRWREYFLSRQSNMLGSL
jgi:hypothetical protein